MENHAAVRIQRLLAQLSPPSHNGTVGCEASEVAATRIPPRLIGFPRTVAVAKMFSAVTEKIHDYLQVVKPETDLVDLAEG